MISESKELELEKLFEFKIGTKNKEIIKKITLIEKAVARHLPGVSIIVSKLAF